MKFGFWNSSSYLTINVFILTFLHILGSIKHVAENVDEVKDITKDIMSR